jgi:hypothetical protein
MLGNDFGWNPLLEVNGEVVWLIGSSQEIKVHLPEMLGRLIAGSPTLESLEVEGEV